MIQKDRQAGSFERERPHYLSLPSVLETESKRAVLICDILFSFTFNVISTELAVATRTQDNDVLGL